MPDRPSQPWAPRPQRPADSYTSLRQLREQIAAQRRAQTGETAAVPPPDPPKRNRRKAKDSPAPERPQATQPLPQPGAPLFGPHGIVSRPLPAVQRSTLAESASESDVTRHTPSFGHLFGTPSAPLSQPALPAEAEAPSAPQRLILPRPAAALRALFGRGEDAKASPTARASRIVTMAIGLIAIAVLIARPLIGQAAARPPHKTPPSGIHSGITPAPTATAMPSYAPVAIDTTHPPPVLWAESAFLMDETTGAVLYGKNPNEELPMASTTKLMTAVVALAHADPSMTITITPDAASTFCTCLGLHAGERYSLHDLLYGMLMISGNDAAEAIADGVGGSPTTFVKWMNDTAVALGLTHTHYNNPHGLDDPQHYSSARDLAVLGRYALSIPLIHQITQTRYYTIPATSTHPRHDLVNQHQDLWWYPGADGGKPGWTPAAQFVDILSAVRNGHRLIAVVMHSENDWVTDIRDLLNWGFNDFTWISPHDILQKQFIPFADAYQDFVWDVPSRMITDGERLYSVATGYSVSGPFLTYFNAQGGEASFGLPEGMPVPTAQGSLTQRFDKSGITCHVATGNCQTVP
jgi:D-alanyl-D-alanine carboxypeptidase